MNKQIICITQAELRAMKYGQDLVTQMASSADQIEQTVDHARIQLNLMVKAVQSGKAITEKELLDLRDNYLPKLDENTRTIQRNAQLLWRSMQDNENEERYRDEVRRGVNR